MNLTYKELAKIIAELPEDHMNDNVTIFDEDESEFYGVKSIDSVPHDMAEDIRIDTPSDGILDEGCIYLILDKWLDLSTECVMIRT